MGGAGGYMQVRAALGIGCYMQVWAAWGGQGAICRCRQPEGAGDYVQAWAEGQVS